MKRRTYSAGLAFVVFALWVSTASAQVQVYDPVTEGWRNYGCNSIDTAIDDFNADTTLDGKILKLPAGLYIFSHQITPRPNSQIVGDPGAHLQASSALNSHDLIKLLGDGVKITGIFLDRATQTRSSVTGNGINLAGYKFNVMQDLTVEMQNNCITSQAQDGGSGTLADTDDAIIQRCVLRYTKAEAIRLRGWSMTVRNCKITHTLSHGVDLTIYKQPPAYEQAILNIMETGFHFCNGNAIKVTGAMGGATVEGNNVVIDNNIIEQSYADGISLIESNHVNITKNQIRGCGTSITPPTSGNFYDANYSGWSISFLNGGYSWGIYIPSLNNHITIDSNVICSNRRGGIYLENTSTEGQTFVDGPDNVIISNNQMYDGSASGDFGIWVDAYEDDGAAIHNVTINANQIRDFGMGIAQEGPVYRLIITNNNCYSGGIYIGGGYTTLIKEHNIE